MQAAVQAPSLLPQENMASTKAVNPGVGGSEFMTLLLFFMQQKSTDLKDPVLNSPQNNKDMEKEEQEVPTLMIPDFIKSILLTRAAPEIENETETGKIEGTLSSVDDQKNHPDSENLRRGNLHLTEVIRNIPRNMGDSNLIISSAQNKHMGSKAKNLEEISIDNGAKELILNHTNDSTAEELMMKEEKAYVRGLTKTKHALPFEDESKLQAEEEVFLKYQEKNDKKTPSVKTSTDVPADIKLKELPQDNSQGQKEKVENYSFKVEVKETSTILSDSDFSPVSERTTLQELPAEFSKMIIKHLGNREGTEGSKDLIIHLEPKELGKLVVKLTDQEGVISVKIVAESSETRGLLESNLANLRQSLADQGIKYGNLQIDLGSGYFQQGQQQEWRQQNRQVFNQYSFKKEDGFSEIITEESGKNILGVRSTVDYKV